MHILIFLKNSYIGIIYIFNYQNAIYNNHLVEFKDLYTHNDIFILWWNSKKLNSKGLGTKYGNNLDLHINVPKNNWTMFIRSSLRIPFQNGINHVSMEKQTQDMIDSLFTMSTLFFVCSAKYRLHRINPNKNHHFELKKIWSTQKAVTTTKVNFLSI